MTHFCWTRTAIWAHSKASNNSGGTLRPCEAMKCQYLGTWLGEGCDRGAEPGTDYSQEPSA